MKRVGDLLKNETGRVRDASFRDVLARSAFNRYYYASYLKVRDLLGKISPKDRTARHKAIPAILKRLSRNIRRSVRKSLAARGTGWPSSERELSNVSRFLNEYADLLTRSYGVRCVADYHPELKITEKTGSILLDNTTLSEAQNWPQRADSLSGAITKICRQLGVCS